MTEGERIALRELRRHFPGFTLADLRDSGRESSHTYRALARAIDRKVRKAVKHAFFVGEEYASRMEHGRPEEAHKLAKCLNRTYGTNLEVGN
jgi:predicted hydrocarbon binding protein